MLLLTPSPVDGTTEKHQVFFLLNLADEPVLEAIHAVYLQQDPRGRRPTTSE